MKNNIRKLRGEEFPSRLLEIPQPPKQLFVEGELPSEDEYKFLTVVGSRKCSNYGKEACEKIITELKGQNVVIVSGLAYGIDSMAHKTAMKVGLKTIAVPGSGLSRKVLYPAINKKLADEIVEKGGALLSEFDLDQVATLWTFPQRNRIMAGMSHAILVIEAGEKSGTLITARLAVEYNRDLLIVPGSIFSPTSIGSNQMINLGAAAVSSGEDVLRAMGINIETKQKSFDFDDPELSEIERKILKILAVNPLSKDELLIEAGISIVEANSLISIMEIKGLVLETMGEIRLVM